MKNHHPGRPPRLSNVFRTFDPPLYFITFCTFDHNPLLANEAFHSHFIELMHRKSGEVVNDNYKLPSATITLTG